MTFDRCSTLLAELFHRFQKLLFHLTCLLYRLYCRLRLQCTEVDTNKPPTVLSWPARGCRYSYPAWAGHTLTSFVVPHVHSMAPAGNAVTHTPEQTSKSIEACGRALLVASCPVSYIQDIAHTPCCILAIRCDISLWSLIQLLVSDQRPQASLRLKSWMPFQRTGRPSLLGRSLRL